MIINRIKQTMTYIFGKYRKQWDIEVRKLLTSEEFKIFDSMGRYDKIHSYRLMKFVQEDEFFRKNPNIEFYLRAALLHDCGKEHLSLYRRIKKVLFGDKLAASHSEMSYLKVKDLNIQLAEFIRGHHKKPEKAEMEHFQRLDDR